MHAGIVSPLSTTSPAIIDNNYIPVFPQQQRWEIPTKNLKTSKKKKTDEGNFMEGLNKVNAATCDWWHLSDIYFDRWHHLSCYFAYIKTLSLWGVFIFPTWKCKINLSEIKGSIRTLNEQKSCQNQSKGHETIRKQKTGTVTQPAIQRRLHSFPRQSERVQLPSASPERTRKPAQPARPN